MAWREFKSEVAAMLLQQVAMGLFKRSISVTKTSRHLISYLNYVVATDDRSNIGKPNLRLVDIKKETSLSSCARNIVINNYTNCKVKVVTNNGDKVCIDITKK